MFDLYLYFKYSLRYINFLKNFNNINSFFDNIKIEKFVVFFNIKNITDLNHNYILSSIFFFKYYFGVIPFFTNYQQYFKLNINYYNFLIEYIFYKKYIFYSLYYFINDIYYFINKVYFIIKN